MFLPRSTYSNLRGLRARSKPQLPILLAVAIFPALWGCAGLSAKQPGTSAAPPSGTDPTAGSPPESPAKPSYFPTEPSHATYLPRSDSYCASAITTNPSEPRPDNDQANQTVPTPPFNWAFDSVHSGWTAKQAAVTGNFKGTTTEIIQWAACKWGIDEDTIRADAVKESNWHQNAVGDVCGPVGEASYGILQIKNEDCTGAVIHGGYPQTQQGTALNVDWYAAHIRSCYDGDFYATGYNWLYDGQTVDQIAAQNGWNFVFWTCIGFHYSGNWSPGQPYQLAVQQILASRPWESQGF